MLYSSLLNNIEAPLPCTGCFGEQQYNGAGNPTVVYFTPYLFKLDANRNLEWEFVLDIDSAAAEFNNYKKIMPLPDGNYVVSGTNLYRQAPGQISNCYTVLSKFSPTGNLIWHREYLNVTGSLNAHNNYDLDTTTGGGFILCGQARNFANDPINNPIPQQVWLVKTDAYGCVVLGCQNTSIAENPAGEILIYPNPASTSLNIYLPQAQGSKISLYDTKGQLVQTHSIHRNNLTLLWNINQLSNGIYFLKLEGEKGIIKTEKIIISK